MAKCGNEGRVAEAIRNRPQVEHCSNLSGLEAITADLLLLLALPVFPSLLNSDLGPVSPLPQSCDLTRTGHDFGEGWITQESAQFQEEV